MKYPPGCKEIHVELSDNELIRRLKVSFFKQVSAKNC